MLRNAIYVLAAIGLASWITSSARAEFLISAEPSCSDQDSYAFNFSDNIAFPNFTVKVSSDAVFPTLTFRVVTSPDEADLILVDGESQADMKVCRTSAAFGITTIKVSDYAALPNITVKLSSDAWFYNYKIFVSSEILSEKEAAALFAVIWESNRRQKIGR